MNISNFNADYFVVARAAYNTKHVISCSKFIHIIYKNSFPRTQTINRDSTTITCYAMLKEKLLFALLFRKRDKWIVRRKKGFCIFNLLNPELNPICYLLALLAHHFLHVSRIRVKSLTLRSLMSYIYIYIYGAPILDVSRSHTTTQHSR